MQDFVLKIVNWDYHLSIHLQQKKQKRTTKGNHSFLDFSKWRMNETEKINACITYKDHEQSSEDFKFAVCHWVPSFEKWKLLLPEHPLSNHHFAQCCRVDWRTRWVKRTARLIAGSGACSRLLPTSTALSNSLSNYPDFLITCCSQLFETMVGLYHTYIYGPKFVINKLWWVLLQLSSTLVLQKETKYEKPNYCDRY